MTNFGAPGGGSPESWGGRRPDDAYGPPADPRYDPRYETQPGGWGEPPTQRYEPVAGNGWDDRGVGQPVGDPGYRPYQPVDHGYPPAGQPGYPPAGPYPGGYPAAEPYAQPPAPPKRGKGPLITVLAVLAVLLLVGTSAYYFLGRDEPAPVAEPTAQAPAPTDPSAQLTATPGPASAPPAPESSADPRFVKVGQCVRNEGPASGKPKLVISDCTAKTYQVLRRFDGATSGEKDAEKKCAKVEGYTNWYFFNSELDTLDFVLCLKLRR